MKREDVASNLRYWKFRTRIGDWLERRSLSVESRENKSLLRMLLNKAASLKVQGFWRFL